MSNEVQDAVSEDDWAAALAEAGSPSPEVPEPTPAAPTAAPATTAPASPAAIFQKLTGQTAADGRNDIDLVLDIPVQLTVELGRTRIPIKHILQLAQGSVIELDAMAGEPMDVLVNGCLIAQGEVVVVNDKFGIRLTDIVTPSERVRRLHR